MKSGFLLLSEKCRQSNQQNKEMRKYHQQLERIVERGVVGDAKQGSHIVISTYTFTERLAQEWLLCWSWLSLYWLFCRKTRVYM